MSRREFIFCMVVASVMMAVLCGLAWVMTAISLQRVPVLW